MVPPNWQHPKYTEDDAPYSNRIGEYRPLFDRPFHRAMVEWFENYSAWRDGTHKDFAEYGKEYPNYWEWSGGPPDPEYYRPEWKEGEATWFQVYETVSEGAPVTPPFATKEELVDYLVENGDFWDQKRRTEGSSVMRCTPWPREEAVAFVMGPGWAPSLVMVGGRMMSGTEAACVK